jgi:transcription initiation factor IIE alpha subunit
MKLQKRPVDLVVSTIAMFILILFNERAHYTVDEISNLLQLDLETVRKNLYSLTQPKYKILTKKVHSDEDVEMSSELKSESSQ